MVFEPHQAVTVVSCDEPAILLPFVLKDSLVQIAGDADVESMASVGHDVGKIGALLRVAIVEETSVMRSDEVSPEILRLRLRLTSKEWNIGQFPATRKLPFLQQQSAAKNSRSQSAGGTDR